MAREIELECPSGLVVLARGVKGKDLDGLRDRRKVASGEAISSLLDDCTLEVRERSIYGKLPNFTWADTLVGDRTFAVIGLRQITAGPTYDFRVRCQDRECREMIDWTIELNELPIKRLSPESAERFQAGNVFETTLDGKVIKFSLPTGRSQTKLVKYAATLDAQARQKRDNGEESNGASSQEGRALLGLAGKIVSVQDVTNVMTWLGELDLKDIGDLSRTMDKVDCGVETGIMVECAGPRGCGLRQEVELPLDSKFFLRNPI
jgi:hypothetical protein